MQSESPQVVPQRCMYVGNPSSTLKISQGACGIDVAQCNTEAQQGRDLRILPEGFKANTGGKVA